jgi:predicted SnoaL-like aldol condensation-catalyzing enzyme
MSEQNKRVVCRFFTEVCSEGNIALIDDLFACDWVGHAPRKEFNGPEELKLFVAVQRRAFPDLKVRVEDLIAEGNKVTTRWTLCGTHQAIPPTSKLPNFGRMTLARLANRKIIEAWANWNGLDLLMQLGALRSLNGPFASWREAIEMDPVANTPDQWR